MRQMNYQPQASGAPGQPTPVFELSGWWPRAGALIVDSIIVGAISFGLGLMLGIADVTTQSNGSGGSAFTSFDLKFTLFSIVIASIYYCGTMVRSNGQTVGKQATGIRVVREDGEEMTLGFAFVRQILVIQILFNTISWIVLWIPGLLNYLWPIWDDNNQALHDKIVKSRVVKTDPVMYQQYGPPGQYPPPGQPYAPQPYAPPQPYGAPPVAPPPGQPYAPPTPPPGQAPPVAPPQQPGQPYAPPAPPQPGQAPPPMPQQPPGPQQPPAPQPPMPQQPPPAHPPAPAPPAAPQPPVPQPPMPQQPPVAPPPAPPAPGQAPPGQAPPGQAPPGQAPPQPPPPPQPPAQPQPYQPPPGFTNPVPDDD